MSGAARATHLPSLDGLRGLALLAVLAHQFERVEAPFSLAERVLAMLLDRGWVGVQLFFVLSGFLITGLLMDGGRTPAALGRFFHRRALRILPMYGLLLVALLAVLPMWPAVAGRCGPVPAATWPYWTLLSNWTEPFQSPHDGCLVHLWSLAVEEQFYLLWPLFVAGRGPRAVLGISGVVFVAACVARAVLPGLGVPADAIYTWSPCRMDALAAGAAVAALVRLRGGRGLSGMPVDGLAASAVVLLGIGWFVADGYARVSPVGQAVGYPLLALSFAALLAAGVRADAPDTAGGRSALRRALSPGWLRFVGRHSYAMYLLHRPVDLLIGRPVLAALGAGTDATLVISVAYTVATTLAVLGLAVLTWRWIEAPCLRRSPA